MDYYTLAKPDDVFKLEIEKYSAVNIDIVNGAEVNSDYLVTKNDFFYSNSINEYCSIDDEWLEKRFRENKNLGFKHNQTELTSSNTISVKDPLKKTPNLLVNEIVFVYDYPWGHNYQHWLITSVSRLFLFLEIKKQFANIKLVIRENEPSFKPEILKILRIEESDIIYIKGPTKFKQVFIPAFISFSGIRISEFASYCYNKISKSIPKSTSIEKVYIARDDSNGRRPLENRKELDLLLSNYNYQKVFLENLSLQEKISLFVNAKNIIGDFSAGWANLVFCNNDTSVILLEHEMYKFNTFYSQIAKKLNFNFVAIDSPVTVKRYVLTKIIGIYYKLKKNRAAWVDGSSWSVCLNTIDKTLKKNRSEKSIE